MQTPQTLNIIQLIEKNSITRLSKDYENRLINKIKENFTENQQQMFLGTFFCLLNYDLKKDFVVDFDNVWKWLGFSRKDPAKRLLEKHFMADIDYKTVLRRSVENLEGGRPFEEIMLNVKTFKKFCLKAGTKKADEIHDYYTNLEELLQETINEQTNELCEQIRVKNDESERKDIELRRIEEEKERILEEKNIEMQAIKEEKEKLEKKYIKPPKMTVDQKNVVYLITTDEGEKNREYAVGKSFSLSKRIEEYNNNKIHDFKVAYYVSLKSPDMMDIVETTVLMKLDEYKSKANRDVYRLPESCDLKIFTDIFDECVKFFEDVENFRYAKKSQKTDPEKAKEYREENREKIQERQKEYIDRNLEPLNEMRRIINAENPEISAAKCKKYYDGHREQVISQVMDHYYDNREVILEERKEFYQNNREVILEERKDYYEENYETKIAPQREALEQCECGMTITHYCMKKHKTTDLHKKLMEKKKNAEADDEPSQVPCDCGMNISVKNFLRHKKSERHKRLMVKKEAKAAEVIPIETEVVS
jgi:MSV199 domain